MPLMGVTVPVFAPASPTLFVQKYGERNMGLGCTGKTAQIGKVS